MMFWMQRLTLVVGVALTLSASSLPRRRDLSRPQPRSGHQGDPETEADRQTDDRRGGSPKRSSSSTPAGKQIKDLTGLGKCTSLAEVKLSDNAIQNQAPLSGLVNIQSLYLSKNQIKDLAPLAPW